MKFRNWISSFKWIPDCIQIFFSMKSHLLKFIGTGNVTNLFKICSIGHAHFHLKRVESNGSIKYCFLLTFHIWKITNQLYFHWREGGGIFMVNVQLWLTVDIRSHPSLVFFSRYYFRKLLSSNQPDVVKFIHSPDWWGPALTFHTSLLYHPQQYILLWTQSRNPCLFSPKYSGSWLIE